MALSNKKLKKFLEINVPSIRDQIKREIVAFKKDIFKNFFINVQQYGNHYIDQQDINEVVKDPADYKAAIDGYFIYLATMLLGDEVLESITSDLGDSKDQEGIVVRGLYPDVFKITGSFIIKGMESQFRK